MTARVIRKMWYRNTFNVWELEWEEGSDFWEGEWAMKWFLEAHTDAWRVSREVVRGIVVPGEKWRPVAPRYQGLRVRVRKVRHFY